MRVREIKKFSLNQLNKDEMDARQKNALKGGGGGYCNCTWCGCMGIGTELLDSIDEGHTNIAETAILSVL